MIRFLAVSGLALLFSSCLPSANSAEDPLVFEPRFERNISTIEGQGKKLGTGSQVLASEIYWKDSTGRLDSLSSLRGKVVVLNIWATWCVHCDPELSDLLSLYKDFDGEVEVVAVAVDNTGDVFAKVKRFVDRRKLPFQFVVDPHMKVLTNYYQGDGAIPQTFFIDRDGYLSRYTLGRQPLDRMRDYIEEAM